MSVCKEEFGVPREALGIIASARAVMYYSGRSQRVHLDMVREGTRFLSKEKEFVEYERSLPPRFNTMKFKVFCCYHQANFDGLSGNEMIK